MFFFLRRSIPTSRSTGNITPARIPRFRSSDARLDTKPTRVGPPEQPTSPASASNAKSDVPPFRRADDALLKLPGHIIPTENPQTEQPISDTNADGARDIHRYDRIHKRLLPIMNLSRSIRSPLLP